MMGNLGAKIYLSVLLLSVLLVALGGIVAIAFEISWLKWVVFAAAAVAIVMLLVVAFAFIWQEP